MSIELIQHAEEFLVTPYASIARGSCQNPQCGEAHWRFSLGWFVWTLEIVF